jgi:hypothetical protein
MTVTYFVSYAHSRGFGWVVLSRTAPVTTGAHVTELVDAIADHAGDPQVAILGFQPLAQVPAGQGAAQ